MDNKSQKPNLLSIDYGISTHAGNRKTNQDVVFAKVRPSPEKGVKAIFAVADGMGGHPGGSQASHLACEMLSHFFDNKMVKLNIDSPTLVNRHLSDTVFQIDRQIRLKGLKEPNLKHMGTTLSCLAITKNNSIIVHVGDCRIYRLRGGFLSCLTVDHTFVQDMISEGVLDPANEQDHPLRHTLTRTVGTKEILPLVDSRVDSIKLGDRFLICSDGLYKTMNETTICNLLAVESCATDIVTEFMEMSLNNGALDNISAIVIKL